MTDTEFEALAVSYKEAQQELKRQKAVVETIGDEIKEELNNRGVVYAEVGLFKISWNEITMRVLSDSTLKDQEPEIYERFLVTRVTRPLKVWA